MRIRIIRERVERRTPPSPVSSVRVDAVAFIYAVDGWSVSCTRAVSSHGWASACRESSGQPGSDSRCERAPAPRSVWADCGEHGKKTRLV